MQPPNHAPKLCVGSPREQERPQRTRHLYEVHHPSRQAGGLGHPCAGARRGELYERPDHRPWQAGHPRQAEAADYILYYKPNIPIALIEAKDNNHAVGDGIQQGLEYATTLDIPFVFSSNGDAFLFHDRTGRGSQIESELPLESFPTPTQLWSRYCGWKGLARAEEAIVLQDYYEDAGGKEPRYYQSIAINRAIEAIAKGQDRILLVIATGMWRERWCASGWHREYFAR